VKNNRKARLVNATIYPNESCFGARMFGTLRLTDFSRSVLKACCAIPFGQTRSYQWIARRIGKPRACRAVGQVLKKNPFPLLIPCHRVVSSQGDSGGYSGGRKIKEQLLRFERQMLRMIKSGKCKMKPKVME
jgi:O-6-methylguanine DNA methyltransferase